MKKRTFPVYDIDDFNYLGRGGFYANDFNSHLKQHRHFILAPHRHNFYLSVLFTKGSGKHEIEFNSYDIKPGAIFMLGPGEVHTWKLSKDIQGYIFFHTREFFDLNFTYEKIDNYPFYCCLRNTPLIVLKKNEKEKVESIYQEILDEYRQNELWKFQKLASLINILYISLSRDYLPQKMRVEQNLSYLAKLKKLENLIDKNFTSIKSPGEYSKLMHISEKHLNRICKTCLQKTVSDLIADRIILEAKRMLVFSGYTVSEIINQLGYSDHPYFFRFFKKKTSFTPLEFLNKYRAS